MTQDAIVKGSQGMLGSADQSHTTQDWDLLIIDRFLWVAFQLDSICSQETDESIINTLQSLPKDFPETFDRILRTLEQSKAADPRLRKKRPLLSAH